MLIGKSRPVWFTYKFNALKFNSKRLNEIKPRPDKSRKKCHQNGQCRGTLRSRAKSCQDIKGTAERIDLVEKFYPFLSLEVEGHFEEPTGSGRDACFKTLNQQCLKAASAAAAEEDRMNCYESDYLCEQREHSWMCG